MTPLIPAEFTEPIIKAGLPLSSAEFVALALVYSATAGEARCVEPYGKDRFKSGTIIERRWNGRVVLTLGDRYTELEEPIADLRPAWFGEENTRLTWEQQAATDLPDKLSQLGFSTTLGS